MSELTAEERTRLLQLARETLRRVVYGEPPAPFVEADFPPRLLEPGAVFVTLTVNGELRGCIGSLAAHRPLALDVRENALAAAFDDPRFSPVDAAEFERLRIEISVLTPHAPLDYADAADLLRKLRPGVDGVVIERGWHRATFLPQVWEQLPDPEEFLGHLCYKAGLPAQAWRSGDLKVYTYQAEKFQECE